MATRSSQTSTAQPSHVLHKSMPPRSPANLTPTNLAPTNLDRIWWLNPGKVLVWFMLPLYLTIVGVVPAFWPHLAVVRYGTYLTPPMVALGAGCLLVCGVSCWLGTRIDVSPRTRPPVYEVNERFMIAIGLITVSAYLVWFGPAILRGEMFARRDELNRTPGVTSFTQFGVTFVVCYAYARLVARQVFRPLVHLLLASILVLTLGRVFIWSERLALIEVGTPAVVCLLAYGRPKRGWLRAAFRLVSKAGPLLAIPTLLGFFTATEIFRSWSSKHYQSQGLDLGEFMVSRLVTYYYTALNNGAGLLSTSDWPSYDLIYVLNWAYRLPLGIGRLLWSAAGRSTSPTELFLAHHGDPEFNNMSGLFPIVHDLGVFGGLTCFGVMGLAIGISFRAMRAGRPLGFLLFPTAFVACIEILRIAYLSESRCFLIVVGAALASQQLRARPSLNALPSPRPMR